MLNYHSGIYKTINDEIQLCLIMIAVYTYKTIDDEIQTLFNYDRAIYKRINDEIRLCLIMIELHIKQLIVKHNFD